MTHELNDNFRKIVRDFKGRLEFMNRIPKEDSITLFFEICNLNLNNYIKIEKERFPNKTIKDIIIDMHKINTKLKRRKKIYGNKI